MTSTHATSPDASQRPLLHALARNWWLILLKGIAAILFGVLAFIWPGVTLFTLVILWGAFTLVDGVLSVAAAIMGGVPAPRWWLAIIGVLGIVVGLMTFVWPQITALVLLIFIAAWALVLGIMQIVGAIQLRKEIDNEWWLVAGGVLSVLFGLLLLARPGEGVLALIWVIGAYAIVFGIMLVSLSLRLRSHAH